jgi:cation diffusion facilitator CzcD-associated flavoprotein CzcO
MPPRGSARVAVIGAGISGIAVAARLRKINGIRLTIFESGHAAGGTWLHNQYPGAACDVPSILYSFSFTKPRQWSETYAKQPEILDYLQTTARDHGVTEVLRTGVTVRSCQYDTARAVWHVTLDDGAVEEFDFVIASVGMLNDPHIPAIPGLSDFPGEVFHSSRWPKDYEPDHRRVAVVGTGSSSAQIVPAIQGAASHVFVLQREPGWLLPKPNASPRLRRVQRAVPGFPAVLRLTEYLRREAAHGKYVAGGQKNRNLEELSVSYLRSTVADAALRNALTPNYPYGCKRVVRDNNFYSALSRDNVTLTTGELTEIRGKTLVTATGDTAEDVDTIVFATGFKAQEFLSTIRIIGPSGREVHEIWREEGGANALLGVCSPHLPNFFMMYGPNSNTATTSMSFVLERQASFITRIIKYMVKHGRSTIRPTALATAAYNAWLQQKINKTVWTAGCSNYFTAGGGRVVTNWPCTSVLYNALLHAARPNLPNLFRVA